MKKIILITLCLTIGGVMAFGQTSKEEKVQKILEKNVSLR